MRCDLLARLVGGARRRVRFFLAFSSSVEVHERLEIFRLHDYTVIYTPRVNFEGFTYILARVHSVHLRELIYDLGALPLARLPPPRALKLRSVIEL